ncbi:hypothetical protein [Providencia rettgeri]|uniref:hypothetical protein n=1 Tax=Providencia rettgeri TaxID=587 RepID=UPI001B372496|nr:hypothetical protein [Providencia rettgeri]MBQ0367549.1 hypothetical protein [Providencia rettgeri]
MKLNNEKFIATLDFNKHLESKGWYLKSVLNDIVGIWRSSRYPDSEILQPIDINLMDFSRRAEVLLSVLSETQDKKINEIVDEIN